MEPCSPPAVNVSPSSLNAGDQAEITGCGFGGNQSLSVEFHSDPVFLGTTLSDAAGNYSMAITIPADAPPGNHTVVVIGPDSQSISTAGEGAVFVQGPPSQHATGRASSPTSADTSGVASGTVIPGTGGFGGAGTSGVGPFRFRRDEQRRRDDQRHLGGQRRQAPAAPDGTGRHRGTTGGAAGTGGGADSRSTESAQGGTTSDSGRAGRDSGDLIGDVPGPSSAFGFDVEKTEGDRSAAARAAEKGDRSLLSKGIRSADEVSTDLKTIAINLMLAAALILLIGFPADLFNATLLSNYDEVRGWFRFGHRAVAGFERRFDALPTSLRLATFGFLGAVLYGFLDPNFGFNRGSAVTVVGLLAALGTISFVLDHLRNVYLGRTIGTVGQLKAYPIGLIVAAILVLASRLAHFQPGYVFGVFTGLAFQEELSERHDGKGLAVGSVGVLAVAIIALLLRAPIDNWASEPNAGFGVLVLDAALATLWLAGVGAIVWGLVPLKFFYGEVLKAWSFWAWLAIWGTGSFLFVHTLLQPQLGLYGTADRTSFFSVTVLFLSFGAFSVAFWAYFRFRRPRPVQGPPELQRGAIAELDPPRREDLPVGAARRSARPIEVSLRFDEVVAERDGER